jgi:hypothetical protein
LLNELPGPELCKVGTNVQDVAVLLPAFQDLLAAVIDEKALTELFRNIIAAVITETII